MPKLWLAGASAASLQATLDLQDALPPRFRWSNEGEARAARKRIAAEYQAHGQAEIEALAFRAMPTPVFEITDPGFRFDYFECGIACASRRLRAVLNLPADVAEYRNIDSGRSPVGVREMGYAALQPLAFADPFDHERTPGRTETVGLAEGRTVEAWRPARPVPGQGRTIYWRAGFAAPAPLFRVLGTPWTLATEALAKRVMDAGVTDLVFQDVEGVKAPGELAYRRR